MITDAKYLGRYFTDINKLEKYKNIKTIISIQFKQQLSLLNNKLRLGLVTRNTA